MQGTSSAHKTSFYLGFVSPRIVRRLVLVLLSFALLSPALTGIARAIEPGDTPEFITTFGLTAGSGNGQFNYPKDIATDAASNVYVADTANGRIQKFSSTGTYLMQWGTFGTGNGEFGYIEGIAADSAGNVYVSDTDYHRIQKFDSNGTYLTQWGGFGSANGQFNYPYGITVDNAGNVYVVDSSNQRVQKFSSAGDYLTKWGTQGSGDGQFFYANGIAIDQSGNFYVADVGNKRIQKFDSNGSYLAQWGTQGSGDGQFQFPTDVTIDQSANVYVADTNNHRIQKFSSTGTYLAQWGTQGSGDGQFVYPEGITTDSAGNLYIVDNGNDRIQKFGYPKTASPETPSGSQEIQLATPAATDISYSDVVTEASLASQDQSNTFPLGLVDFELTAPTGSTQQISLTFVTDLTPGEVTTRKYHSTNKTYSDVPGATVTETTLSGKHALLLTYDIADGGPLDDDGLANGTIVDPVGLAVANGAAAPGAPNSGAGTTLSLPIIASVVVIPALVYAVQKRRSRR